MKRCSRAAPLLLPLLAIGAFAFFIRQDMREGQVRWQEEESAARAERERRRERFAAGELEASWQECRDAWREELGMYWPLAALAWTRDGLDGYALAGTDVSTWRQLRCDAEGVRFGPRVEIPRIGVPTPEAVRPPEEASDADFFSALLPDRALGDDLAVEMVRDAAAGRLLVRRWRPPASAALPAVEPPESPAWPLLVAAPRFAAAPSAALPPLVERPRFDWLEQSDQAFARIAELLPPGATVSGIDLASDSIEISIHGSVPAFDGDPPAPYGDLELDEYGVPEDSWWYPREIPGFGCEQGAPLEEVAAAFAKARTRTGGRLDSAWYSCSTAYGNGRDGAWHLVAR